MGRPKGMVTAPIENFIRMEARGEPHRKILEECFNVPPDADLKTVHNAECRMSDWRKRPEYESIWQDELRATVRRCVPGAMRRITEQVNNENDWVANKAANDCITLATRVGAIRTEDSALNVRIEGMVDLGSPEQDEQG